jgi:peptidoglycan/LPS O-acetylase OafA/YrhL
VPLQDAPRVVVAVGPGRHDVSPLTSLVLDVTRFSLAFAVAWGHWTQPYFQEGWPDLTRPAVAAVGGFFVLSGFTIRLLTPRGVAFTPSSFFVERLSRFWSVALPAIALTLVLDFSSYLINRAYYIDGWGESTSLPLWRVVVNVLFASQVWGRDIELFSNSLFWSLSYEAGFYFLYCLFRSTDGHARYPLALCGCILVGPNIALMLVPWLGGVLLYDVSAGIRPRARAGQLLLAGAGSLGLLLTLLAVLIFRHDVAQFARALTVAVREGFTWADGSVDGPWLGLQLGARRIEGDLISGAGLFWIVLLFTMILIRGIDRALTVPPRLVRLARRLGDFTFPLYLFHFPLFVFVGALALYDRHSSAQKTVVFAAVCALIFMSYPATTALKWVLRRRLGQLVRAVQAQRTMRQRLPGRAVVESGPGSRSSE